MTANGAFNFVLHSHMPYTRLAGRWTHGEAWIHEAASETYIPLLEMLYDLKEDDVPYGLTIGITPALAEQLVDETLLSHFDDYLDEKITAAKRDMWLFAPENVLHIEPLKEAIAGWQFERRAELEEPHMHYLAEWYKGYYENIKTAFNERFERDIIGALRHLQDEGYIEIITSAATYGYLPLLSTDQSVHAQIALGISTYEKHFGRKPSGLWLPECAYRPAYETDSGDLRPGIETFLQEQGIKVVFGETHMIKGGQLVGVAAGEVIGPYGEIKQRYTIPNWQEHPVRDYNTFTPYYISDTRKGDERLAQHSGVAMLARNHNASTQVWSADWGYPGDFDYRERDKQAGTSGLRYWRVTGELVDADHKDLYHPDWAEYKVEQHAEHFAHLVGDLLRDHHTQTGGYGFIAATFETELFGRWWFEGVQWIGKVLRHLANNAEIDLIGVSQYLEQYPPQEAIDIPEGSWGAGGNHFTWDNGETHWMWDHIHACEARMIALADAHPQASADEAQVLNQAARELLLLQSADWQFLVTTYQARNYAIERFYQHVERFTQLADSLTQGKPDIALATSLYTRDHIFADIDYRLFTSR